MTRTVHAQWFTSKSQRLVALLIESATLARPCLSTNMIYTAAFLYLNIANAADIVDSQWLFTVTFNHPLSAEFTVTFSHPTSAEDKDLDKGYAEGPMHDLPQLWTFCQRTCSFMLRAALTLLSDLCSCTGRIQLPLPALHYASTAMASMRRC